MQLTIAVARNGVCQLHALNTISLYNYARTPPPPYMLACCMQCSEYYLLVQLC